MLINKLHDEGHLGGSVVEHLPLTQGMILESRDQVPHQAPCMEPTSPSACVSASLSLSLSLSLCLSFMDKKIKSLIKKNAKQSVLFLPLSLHSYPSFRSSQILVQRT